MMFPYGVCDATYFKGNVNLIHMALKKDLRELNEHLVATRKDHCSNYDAATADPRQTTYYEICRRLPDGPIDREIVTGDTLHDVEFTNESDSKGFLVVVLMNEQTREFVNFLQQGTPDYSLELFKILEQDKIKQCQKLTFINLSCGQPTENAAEGSHSTGGRGTRQIAKPTPTFKTRKQPLI